MSAPTQERTCHFHKRGVMVPRPPLGPNPSLHTHFYQSNIQYANKQFSLLIPLMNQPALVLPKFLSTHLIHQAKYGGFIEGCVP